MNVKRIPLIYGIVLSTALVVAGVCLMLACWQVYSSGGEQIYTAEKIAAAFAPIAIPVYVALALTLGGFVLHMALPLEQEKRKIEKNHALMLHKLHEKNDLSACGDQKLVAAIEKEPKLRKLHSLISLAVLAVSAVVFLCYALNGSNFHSSQITESMISAMYVMLPCLAVPFGYAVFTAYFHRVSIRRELELMKLVAAPKKAEPAQAKKPCKLCAVLPYCLLAVAVCLIAVGLMGNGWADVLTKAVNICRECVGLG